MRDGDDGRLYSSSRNRSRGSGGRARRSLELYSVGSDPIDEVGGRGTETRSPPISSRRL